MNFYCDFISKIHIKDQSTGIKDFYLQQYSTFSDTVSGKKRFFDLLSFVFRCAIKIYHAKHSMMMFKPQRTQNQAQESNFHPESTDFDF